LPKKGGKKREEREDVTAPAKERKKDERVGRCKRTKEEGGSLCALKEKEKNAVHASTGENLKKRGPKKGGKKEGERRKKNTIAGKTRRKEPPIF